MRRVSWTYVQRVTSRDRGSEKPSFDKYHVPNYYNPGQHTSSTTYSRSSQYVNTLSATVEQRTRNDFVGIRFFFSRLLDFDFLRAKITYLLYILHRYYKCGHYDSHTIV